METDSPHTGQHFMNTCCNAIRKPANMTPTHWSAKTTVHWNPASIQWNAWVHGSLVKQFFALFLVWLLLLRFSVRLDPRYSTLFKPIKSSTYKTQFLNSSWSSCLLKSIGYKSGTIWYIIPFVCYLCELAGECCTGSSEQTTQIPKRHKPSWDLPHPQLFCATQFVIQGTR